jgi:hypothetical protein
MTLDAVTRALHRFLPGGAELIESVTLSFAAPAPELVDEHAAAPAADAEIDAATETLSAAVADDAP